MKRLFTALLLIPALFVTAWAQPSAPTLSSPSDNATGVSASPMLQWSSVSGANDYTLIYSKNSDLSNSISVTQGNNSYSLSNLDTSTTYYWTVFASDNNGDGPTADTFAFTTVGGAPGAPILSYPALNAPNIPFRPVFRWLRSAGAAAYEIQVSSDSLFQGIAFTSILSDTFAQPLASLSHSSRYHWRVRASSVAGNGPWTNSRGFYTRPQPPAKPVLISPANGSTQQKIRETVLVWDSTRNVDEFNIYLSKNSNMDTIVWDTIVDAPQTSLLIHRSILEPSTTYYWTIVSYDLANFTNEGDTLMFTTAIAPPARPPLVSPMTSSINVSETPTLVWNSVPTASNYIILVDQHSGFPDTIFIGTTTTPDTNVVVTPRLLDDQVYYWKVYAENAGGLSDPSLFWNFTIKTTGIHSLKADRFALEAFPNPSSGSTSVRFDLKEDSRVGIILTDMSGRKVLDINGSWMAQGLQSVNVNTGALEKGVYLLSLDLNGEIESLKLLVE